MLPAPIVYRRRVLPNGLTVLTHESHQSPTVAIQVWYKVGSKDDPAGRSGFAHLFEHLMFKRTRNLKDEQMDRLTEDVGGENNAYTSADVTVYHEVVPSNHLERLLWAEADRMASLQVDESNFFSERDVVKEEYRQGVLANPYGRLDDALEVRSWAVHPYKRPTIGNIAELDAASVADVRAFHATFYRPDNAVLIVAGDLDPAQCDAWVDRYFGRVSAPTAPVPRVTVTEPARTAARRFEVTAPNVPLPALGMTYLIPGVRHPDAPALQLLDAILSGGESARFFQSLIYRQQLASEASTGADLRTDAGLFTVRVTVAGGKSLDMLEKATLAELARVQTTLVSDAELARVRTRFLAASLHSRETAVGIAGELGNAEVLLGEVEKINTSLPALLAVTAEDIQRVAKTYLTESNRVSVRYRNGKASDPVTAPKKTAPKLTAAPPEEQAPLPSAPRRASLPTVTDKRLTSGLRVLHAERPQSGLVTLELVFPQGGGSVAAKQAGLAGLMASLLTRGTTTGKSASQLAAAAEALGGNLSAGAGWDSTSVGITVPQENAAKALTLLSEVVRHAAFAPAELERRRAEMLDEVALELEEPSTIARAVAGRLVFGQGSYSARLGGLPSTLKGLKRSDVLHFYQDTVAASLGNLVITGAITGDEALALATRTLGSWNASATPRSVPPALPTRAPRLVIVDQPGAGQAAVMLAKLSARRGTPSYAIGEVTNSILGGGYSSRLNRVVRIERGLSYGAGSGFSARRYGGMFTMACQTKNESAGEVASLFLAQLTALAKGPLESGELEARKSALLGPLSRELETGSGLAGALAERVGVGLPLLELRALLDRIPTVTAAEVRRYAVESLSANGVHLIVVGDSKKFRASLEKAVGPATLWKKTELL